MAQSQAYKQAMLDYLATQGGKAASADVDKYMASTGIEQYDDEKEKKASKEGRITTEGIIKEGSTADDFETAVKAEDTAEMSNLIDSPWDAAEGIAPELTPKETFEVEPWVNAPNLSAKETSYYDPSGEQQTGYIIDDLTYKDAAGNERVGVGSKVETGGGWYELGEDGGFAIEDPALAGADSEYVDIIDPPFVGIPTFSNTSGTGNVAQPIIPTTPAPTSTPTPTTPAAPVFNIEDILSPVATESIAPTAPETPAPIDTSVPGTSFEGSPYTIEEGDEEKYLSDEERALYEQTNELYNQLTEYTPEETMTQEEAKARAVAQLGQPYDAAVDQAMSEYDKNAIQRGMFGQQPVEAMKRAAIADVELQKQSAIADLSNDLYVQDFEKGQAVDASNLARLSNSLSAGRAQLAQEAAKTQNIMAYKASELATVTEAEKQMRDSAYKRWETLGVSDQAISDILGVPVGIPSGDNMQLQVEAQYKLLLAEYENTLAVQKAAQEYGYDVSLAGYKSDLAAQEYAQKAAQDYNYDVALTGYESDLAAQEAAQKAAQDYSYDVALAGYESGLASQEAAEEFNYDAAMAEYKSALDAAKQSEGYSQDVALAGYKSRLTLNEAQQKMALDLAKLEAEAGIDMAVDLAKLEAEYELKTSFEELKENLVSPSDKIKLLTQAMEMTEIDDEKKKFIYSQYTPEAILQKASVEAGEDGEIKMPSMEEILNEISNEIGTTDYNELMDTYNGLLNVATGGGTEDTGIDLSDYMQDETSESVELDIQELHKALFN